MRLTEADRQIIPQTWSGNNKRTIAEARSSTGDRAEFTVPVVVVVKSNLLS